MASRVPFRWFLCFFMAGLAGCIRTDPVEAALKKLKDPAAPARRQAIDLLRQQHDPRAVEALIVCLDDQDGEVRAAAADTLGALRDSRAIEPLIAHLATGDEEFHQKVVAALGKQDPARAGGRLISLLQDKKIEAADAAAFIATLGVLRYPAAVEALIPRLADEKEQISDAAIKALGQIGPAGVTPLLAGLKDAKPRVRENTAEALGLIGDPRAVGPLIDCLKQPSSPDAAESPPDSATSGKMLDEDKKAEESQMDNGQTGSPGDDDFQVRQKAAEALGKLGPPAVEPLISCLEDQDPSVRSLAASALGQLRDARAIKPLIDCMVELADKETTDEENFENVNVHQSVLDALAGLGEPVVRPLVACLADKDVHVRRDAAEVLGQLHYQPAGTEEKIAFFILRSAWDDLIKLGPPAVGPLVNCLQDDDAGQRQGAARALGQLHDKRAVEPLIARLQDDMSDVRRSAVESLGALGDRRAVKPLIEVFKSNETSVEAAAAEALGALGDEQAVAPLVEELTDTNAGVRQAAAQALEKLHYQPAKADATVTFLIALQSWDKVAKMGPAALTPLTAALSDQDSDVRAGAVAALGDLGDKRAIAPLSQALPDWDLNAGLVSALAKLDWKPASDAEQVYCWIGQKDSAHLKQAWEKTRQVLLDDVSAGDSRKVRNAVFTFVALGEPKILDDLTRILDDQGTKELAELYLNCGNDKLEKAAQEWASNHGYTTITLPTSSGHSSWGSW